MPWGVPWNHGPRRALERALGRRAAVERLDAELERAARAAARLTSRRPLLGETFGRLAGLFGHLMEFLDDPIGDVHAVVDAVTVPPESRSSDDRTEMPALPAVSSRLAPLNCDAEIIEVI